MSNVHTIQQYIVDEFLPDVDPAELPVDHDLLADGVIDSLGLLKLISWIEDHFEVAIGDGDLDPDNFRTVAAIDAFVATAERTPVAGA